jgi:hypothetical protein
VGKKSRPHLPKPRRKVAAFGAGIGKIAGTVVPLGPNGEAGAPDPNVWLPASKVRQRLGGISAVTLWRWRHNPQLGFPPGRRINGRWYFQWFRVADWHSKQANAA